MVQIKLSLAFILAAAAIAPVFDADEWYETRGPYQFYPDEKKDGQFYGRCIERSREIGVLAFGTC